MIELSFLLSVTGKERSRGEGSSTGAAAVARDPLAVGAKEIASFSDDACGLRTGTSGRALRIWALAFHGDANTSNFKPKAIA